MLDTFLWLHQAYEEVQLPLNPYALLKFLIAQESSFIRGPLSSVPDPEERIDCQRALSRRETQEAAAVVIGILLVCGIVRRLCSSLQKVNTGAMKVDQFVSKATLKVAAFDPRHHLHLGVVEHREIKLGPARCPCWIHWIGLQGPPPHTSEKRVGPCMITRP